MPNLLKKALFSVSAIVSFLSAILLTVALGTTRWVTGTILCKTGAEIVNATDPEMAKFIGHLYYGLFRGRKIRKCGLGGRYSEITMKIPYQAMKGSMGIHLWNLFASLCGLFAIVCFFATVKLHHHTERVANFREQVFKFVILQEYFDFSFWICVASPVVHIVNILIVCISGIQCPTLKTKSEEANVTAEDLMY
ncbi:clarin-2 isoform X2 [Hypanus sabinus]|uniref:clarin-2 isoform X2 n=1 Tax=Hypanus sabinus TaxID=79690 RepID=UPI0028C413F8|nr:clarin-2 isoform X2 [Hypanus sabinus]